MRTATLGRDDMVDFIGGDEKSANKTVLAQRVLGEIQVANLTPPPTVNSVVVGKAMGGVILSGGGEFVGVTVTSLPNHFGTIGIGTGFERFLRHINAPFRNIKQH
jgi:hypothetical protein